MTPEGEQEVLDLISVLEERSTLLEENVRLQKLLVAAQEEQVRRLESELAGVRAGLPSNAENELLRQKLELVLRKLFGKSSEALDPAQLELLLSDPPGKAPASVPQGDAPEEAASSAARTERKPRRESVPDHLPVVEEVLLPEAVKACPDA
jgi:hypothetical protein